MDKDLFNRYWKNYRDSIESLLIRKANAEYIDLRSVNQEIHSMSRKWQSDRSIEGLWVQELKDENPSKANRLLQMISSFQFKEEKFETPSMFIYYLLVGLIGIISIFIVISLSLSMWKTILIPVLCIMLAYGFLIPQGNSKKELAKKDIVRKYSKQLDNLKSNIDHILSD